jgi:hypothetical protein
MTFHSWGCPAGERWPVSFPLHICPSLRPFSSRKSSHFDHFRIAGSASWRVPDASGDVGHRGCRHERLCLRVAHKLTFRSGQEDSSTSSGRSCLCLAERITSAAKSQLGLNRVDHAGSASRSEALAQFPPAEHGAPYRDLASASLQPYDNDDRQTYEACDDDAFEGCRLVRIPHSMGTLLPLTWQAAGGQIQHHMVRPREQCQGDSAYVKKE